MHQAAEEFIEQRGVERALAFEDKRGDLVAVRMMVVGMVASRIAVRMAVMLMLGLLRFRGQKIGIDFQLFIQVEAADIEDLGQRGAAEIDLADRGARIDALQARASVHRSRPR